MTGTRPSARHRPLAPAPLLWAVVAGAALLGAGLPGAGAERLHAQEAVTGSDGWIGVGLQAEAECAPGAGEACGPAVVRSVILGGPADAAGIQPGDTLLAMGGRAISRGPHDPAFRRIRPGEPLSVEVARDGRRLRLEVRPRLQPDSLAVVRLRSPAPPSRAGEDPVAPAPPMAYGLALPEAVRTEPARPSTEVRVVTPEGDRELALVRLVPMGRAGELARGLVNAREQAFREALADARLEAARAQELSARARETVRAGAAAEQQAAARLARETELRAARRAAARWRTWIDDSLRAHLDAVHDSVLAVARQRLETMARARAEIRAGVRSRQALVTASGDRMAGAELEGLSPELSEFFGGLEEGVLVLRVLPRTPAAELGLRPGDVIVRAAGRAIGDVDALRSVLRAAGSGPVELTWVRKGEERTGRLQR